LLNEDSILYKCSAQYIKMRLWDFMFNVHVKDKLLEMIFLSVSNRKLLEA